MPFERRIVAFVALLSRSRKFADGCASVPPLIVTFTGAVVVPAGNVSVPPAAT